MATKKKNAQSQQSPSRGIKIVLISAYGILALAATGRSAFQIATKFNEAPLAYLLSLLAAVVYILATVSLLMPGVKWRQVAIITMVFELTGVVVVGALSEFMPQLFRHPSVWSYFGEGYLLIPLVLPILGLIWMSKTNPARTATNTDKLAATQPDKQPATQPDKQSVTQPNKQSVAQPNKQSVAQQTPKLK